MTRLCLDIKIDMKFSDEELTKLKEYYEERVPELTVYHSETLPQLKGFYFDDEFVEVLRQKYMYEIEQEIKSIIN